MHFSFISTAIMFVFYGLVFLSVAVALPPAEHETHLVRRGNISTLSTSGLKTSSLNDTMKSVAVDAQTLSTNPTLGGWCTFHLRYSVSDVLGISG